MRDVEFGWPVGMPLCKSLGDGLWEIRSDLPSRRIARVLFCVIEGELLLLHGFHQKNAKDAAERPEIGDQTNEGSKTMKKRKNRHIGGRFEDWLKEEGIYEETTNASIKKVVAWQIEQAMQKQNLTRTEMARRMATSRVQLTICSREKQRALRYASRRRGVNAALFISRSKVDFLLAIVIRFPFFRLSIDRGAYWRQGAARLAQ